jgi:hypothetical protein
VSPLRDDRGHTHTRLPAVNAGQPLSVTVTDVPLMLLLQAEMTGVPPPPLPPEIILVTLAVVEFEYVPVAVICCVEPCVTVNVGGESATDESDATSKLKVTLLVLDAESVTFTMNDENVPEAVGVHENTPLEAIPVLHPVGAPDVMLHV